MAVIVVAAFRVKLHVPVPLHQLHPTKREPDAGLAVRVTRVPAV
jgi:hypothetical protein